MCKEFLRGGGRMHLIIYNTACVKPADNLRWETCGRAYNRCCMHIKSTVPFHFNINLFVYVCKDKHFKPNAQLF